ncbi:MAG: hypothetical protein H7Z37_02260 [Pyrinomonadaceae bacterium]|nr:hypothetical protein [Pyrinomonadaceae bacterium]
MNVNEDNYYARLSETRFSTVLDYAVLTEPGKLEIKNLPRTQGIYQFFDNESKSFNAPIIYGGIGGFGSLLVLLYANNLGTSLDVLIGSIVVEMIFAGLFVHGLYLFIQYLRSPASSTIFVTPLYVIRTDGNTIKYWGLWSLADFLLTEVYVNGVYSTTKVDITVPDDTPQVNIRGEQNVLSFINTVNEWRTICLRAIEQKRWDYFKQYDLLKTVNEKVITSTFQPDEKPLKDKSKLPLVLRFTSYLIISFIIAILVRRISFGMLDK